jgi:hypothetical protein
MRHHGTWIVLVALSVGVAASACGASSSDSCNPECRAGFECYYGICVPGGPDASGEGTSDVPDVPRDDAVVEIPEVPDVPHETGTCTSALDCDDGLACTQDLCDTETGLCYHPTAPDGTICEDDGSGCTFDVCASGTCTHPPNPDCCLESWQCDDGIACTEDVCDLGTCVNTPRADCCTRDADCMAVDPAWECDAMTGACYAPPGSPFCGPCMTRRDCGDTGDLSDDWCRTYSGMDRGCAKDCIDDLDCPGGAACFNATEDRPCAAGEAGCMCFARLNSCAAFNRFGQGCAGDDTCRAGCMGCGALVCRSGGCTWPCEVLQDCPTGARCDGGVCVGG